jgi:hypothetical protein
METVARNPSFRRLDFSARCATPSPEAAMSRVLPDVFSVHELTDLAADRFEYVEKSRFFRNGKTRIELNYTEKIVPYPDAYRAVNPAAATYFARKLCRLAKVRLQTGAFLPKPYLKCRSLGIAAPFRSGEREAELNPMPRHGNKPRRAGVIQYA